MENEQKKKLINFISGALMGLFYAILICVFFYTVYACQKLAVKNAFKELAEENKKEKREVKK